MGAMELTMTSLAALVAGAYFCRLRLMHPKLTAAWMLLAHFVGLVLALWPGAWAGFGHAPGPAAWASIAAAAAWLVATWPAWRTRHGRGRSRVYLG